MVADTFKIGDIVAPHPEWIKVVSKTFLERHDISLNTKGKILKYNPHENPIIAMGKFIGPVYRGYLIHPLPNNKHPLTNIFM